jgi:hypothetical protein
LRLAINTRGLGIYLRFYLVLQAYPLGALRKVSPAMEILGTERVGKIKGGCWHLLSENQTSRAGMEAALRNTAFLHGILLSALD